MFHSSKQEAHGFRNKGTWPLTALTAHSLTILNHLSSSLVLTALVYCKKDRELRNFARTSVAEYCLLTPVLLPVIYRTVSVV